MKYVIVGTDRPGSNSKKVAELVRELYAKNHGETVEILDLGEIVKGLQTGPQYGARRVGMTRPDKLGMMPRGEGDFGFITGHPERARMLERANLFCVIG